MECRLCGHAKTHKHGKMPNGHQRYFCPHCKQTFAESFDTLYYYRHISSEQVDEVLRAHSEGTSLRGLSRMTGLAYNTGVSVIRSSRFRALLIHNDQVAAVDTEEVAAMRCGHLCKKTEAMFARRSSCRRLLNCYHIS